MTIHFRKPTEEKIAHVTVLEKDIVPVVGDEVVLEAVRYKVVGRAIHFLGIDDRNQVGSQGIICYIE